MVESDQAREVLNTAVLGAITGEEEVAERHDLNQSAREVIASLPAGSALLLVVRGPNLGARFLLNQLRTTVGRKPSSDIFLDDVTVSRKHAEFYQDGSGGYGVRDLGSLNGTYVNRERSEKVGLRNGDEVQIGKYRMVFFASQADASPVASEEGAPAVQGSV